MEGIVENLLKLDLSWNSLRNVIKHSSTFFVHYYIVMPEDYCSQTNN